MTCDLGGLIEKLNWGKAGDFLRIDPGTAAGVEISIRNVVLRPMTADEQAAHNQWLAAEKAKKEKENECGQGGSDRRPDYNSWQGKLL